MPTPEEERRRRERRGDRGNGRRNDRREDDRRDDRREDRRGDDRREDRRGDDRRSRQPRRTSTTYSYAEPSSRPRAPQQQRPPPPEPYPPPPIGADHPKFALGSEFSNFYFGYGSNMSRGQMKNRCPTSQFRGVGHLPGWAWIINYRGFANIIKTDYPQDEVWGLVYSLTATDESRLDTCEGAGKWTGKSAEEREFKKADRPMGIDDVYSREMIDIDFWPCKETEKVDVTRKDLNVMRPTKMLVYVDHYATDKGKPEDDYNERLQIGSKGMQGRGVPGDYVKNVIRRFVPREGPSHLPKTAAQLAYQAQQQGLKPSRWGAVDPRNIPAPPPDAVPENNPEINEDAGGFPGAEEPREKKQQGPVMEAFENAADAAFHPRQHRHRHERQDTGDLGPEEPYDDEPRPRRRESDRDRPPPPRRRQSERERDDGQERRRRSTRDDGRGDRQRSRRRRDERRDERPTRRETDRSDRPRPHRRSPDLAELFGGVLDSLFSGPRR